MYLSDGLKIAFVYQFDDWRFFWERKRKKNRYENRMFLSNKFNLPFMKVYKKKKKKFLHVPLKMSFPSKLPPFKNPYLLKISKAAVQTLSFLN